MALAIIYTVSPEEQQGNERHILGGNQNHPRISMYTEFLRMPHPADFCGIMLSLSVVHSL